MRPAYGEFEECDLDQRATEDSAACDLGMPVHTLDKAGCVNGTDDEVVVLDDLMPCLARGKSALNDHGMRFLESFQSVLQVGQGDSSIRRVPGDFSTELDWD